MNICHNYSIRCLASPACNFVRVFLLAGLAFLGCNSITLSGDTASDSDSVDVTHDEIHDVPSDWIPESGSGTLVPEGEATFFESDSGDDLRSFGLSLLPIAFSGSVYTILAILNDSTPGVDEVAAYRLAPGGEFLETTWLGDVPAALQPSICWTGEVFIASFPIHGMGNSVIVISESGDHIETHYVGDIEVDEPCDWSAGDPKHAFCPEDGPLIADFVRPGIVGFPDVLYLLDHSGAPTLTDREIELPEPSRTFLQPSCFTVGMAGACYSGLPPTDKLRVFFFNRSGDLWESTYLPDDAHIEMGGTIVDAGGAAAAFWANTTDWGENIYIGYSLIGMSGDTIVPPLITDVAVDRYDEGGIAAASSGGNVLVAGPSPAEPGVSRGTYLYLFDLAGNLLDDPMRLEPTIDFQETTTVFWEGDVYSVIWNDGGGIYYRQYRVI